MSRWCSCIRSSTWISAIQHTTDNSKAETEHKLRSVFFLFFCLLSSLGCFIFDQFKRQRWTVAQFSSGGVKWLLCLRKLDWGLTIKFSLETAIADAKALKRVRISVPKCALVVSDKERGRDYPMGCFFSSRSSGSINVSYAIAAELIWIEKLFIDGKWYN